MTLRRLEAAGTAPKQSRLRFRRPVSAKSATSPIGSPKPISGYRFGSVFRRQSSFDDNKQLPINEPRAQHLISSVYPDDGALLCDQIQALLDRLVTTGALCREESATRLATSIASVEMGPRDGQYGAQAGYVKRCVPPWPKASANNAL